MCCSTFESTAYRQNPLDQGDRCSQMWGTGKTLDSLVAFCKDLLVTPSYLLCSLSCSWLFWRLMVHSCTSPHPFHALKVLKTLWDLSSTIPMQQPKGYFQNNWSQWQCMHICSLCQGIYSIVCSPGINRTFPAFISSVGLYKGGERPFSFLGAEWAPCFAQLGVG